MSKDCRSKETSAFEVGEDGLAETGCIEMESIQFLIFGRVPLSEKGHRICIGIDSCAAVTVFPKIVADDYPMLQTASKAKSYGPASGNPLPDLGARKVQVKLKDGRYVNPIVADTHRALMAVSEMNELGHDVFFPGASEASRRMRTTRAVARSWSGRERMTCSSCQSSLFHTDRVFRSPALQVRIPHSRRWNRSRT